MTKHTIHFKDGYGWAAGSKGLVLRSEDGVNWIKEPPVSINSYKLFQNYPNPFNAETVISYMLKVKSDVQLVVYDILGKQVESLVEKTQNAGTYSVTFNASNFASGVYYYKLKTSDGLEETKKLMLLK